MNHLCVEVVDDAFDDCFIEWSEIYYIKRLNWKYGHVSGGPGDETRFWIGLDFETGLVINDCPLTEYIKRRAEEVFDIKIKDVEDLYVNGHTYQCPGSVHYDRHPREALKGEVQYTILYMPNFNDSVMEGFKFMDELIEYKKGRLIMFPSHMPHQGLSTTSKIDMRLTVAWKNCTNTRNSD